MTTVQHNYVLEFNKTLDQIDLWSHKILIIETFFFRIMINNATNKIKKLLLWNYKS